jgi:hypothetical protein
MRFSVPALVLLSCLVSACGSSGGTATTSTGLGACAAGQALAGSSYDVTKSRFAFGSTPVRMEAGGLVRWVGTDGALAIFPDGSEMGILNAGAPEANLPDWSTDSAALSAHVTDYFVSMGVARCQILGTGTNGSASGGGSIDGGTFTSSAGPTSVVLARGVEGIPVVESNAWAQFNTANQSIAEALYWPTVPAAVMTAARAFRDQLADPTALAAYKAKLPSDAQGDGKVVIHHSSSGSSAAFQVVTTYQVIQSIPQDAGPFGGRFGGDLNFDPNGNPVAANW